MQFKKQVDEFKELLTASKKTIKNMYDKEKSVTQEFEKQIQQLREYNQTQ